MAIVINGAICFVIGCVVGYFIRKAQVDMKNEQNKILGK